MSGPNGWTIPDTWDMFGPIACGVIVGVFGCGALLAQTVSYLDSASGDGWGVKLLLLLSLALNVAQTCCDCSRLLKMIIVHDKNLLYDRGSVKALISYYGLGGILVGGVLSTLGTGIATAAQLWNLPSLIYASRGVDPHSGFATSSVVWLVLSTITDILLTVIMCCELLRAKSERTTGRRLTATLVRIAFPSGLIVSALQIMSLVLFVGQDDSSWADFAMIFISKIYGITLITSVALPRDALKSRSTPRLNMATTAPADQASFFSAGRSFWPGRSRADRDAAGGTTPLAPGQTLDLTVEDEKYTSVSLTGTGGRDERVTGKGDDTPTDETFGQVLLQTAEHSKHGKRDALDLV